MAKNRPLSLNVGKFMQGVKNNQPAEKSTHQQTEETVPQQEINAAETTVVNKAEPVQPATDSTTDIQKEQKRIEVEATPENQPPKQVEEKPKEEKPEAKKHAGGRPKKITNRSQKQIFKIDDDTYTKLMMIKAMNKVDIQDVVFTALIAFLEQHYKPGIGINEEAIRLVNETLDKY